MSNFFNIPFNYSPLNTVASLFLEDHQNLDPIEISRSIVILPNRKLIHIFSQALLQQAPTATLMLPKIIAINDLEQLLGTSLLLNSAVSPAFLVENYQALLKPGITTLHRSFILARLIMQKDIETPLNKAMFLGETLGDLIDTFTMENINASALETLNESHLANHWQDLLGFIKIATLHFPKILEELQLLDVAEKQVLVLQTLTKHLLFLRSKYREKPSQTPKFLEKDLRSKNFQEEEISNHNFPSIYAVGINLPYLNIAKLLNSIASFPNSTVIFFGIDFNLEEDLWQKLPISHPQYSLAKLLNYMRLKRSSLQNLADTKYYPTLFATNKASANKYLLSTTNHRELLIQSIFNPVKIKDNNTTAWDNLGNNDMPEVANKINTIGLSTCRAIDKELNRAVNIPRDISENTISDTSIGDTLLSTHINSLGNKTKERGLSRDEVSKAIANISLVVTKSLEEESKVIALALRETLSIKNKTAALVTQNTTLSKAVIAQLKRWNITIDDTAGIPLLHTSCGNFCSLVLKLFENNFAPIDLLSVLKHPLARFGYQRTEILHKTQLLDYYLLREPIPGGKPQELRKQAVTDIKQEEGREISWEDIDEEGGTRSKKNTVGEKLGIEGKRYKRNGGENKSFIEDFTGNFYGNFSWDTRENFNRGGKGEAREELKRAITIEDKGGFTSIYLALDNYQHSYHSNPKIYTELKEFLEILETYTKDFYTLLNSKAQPLSLFLEKHITLLENITLEKEISENTTSSVLNPLSNTPHITTPLPDIAISPILNFTTDNITYDIVTNTLKNSSLTFGKLSTAPIGIIPQAIPILGENKTEIREASNKIIEDEIRTKTRTNFIGDNKAENEGRIEKKLTRKEETDSRKEYLPEQKLKTYIREKIGEKIEESTGVIIEDNPESELSALPKHSTKKIHIFNGEAGQLLATTLQNILQHSKVLGAISLEEYRFFLEDILLKQSFRTAYNKHKRLYIYGSLQATLIHHDLMIIGNLNEGSFPSLPAPSPWMSNLMQQNLGLDTKELQVGTNAYLFSHILCSSEVLLSRSEKIDGSPTTPSRWLLKLENFLRAYNLEFNPTKNLYLNKLQYLLDAEVRTLPAQKPSFLVKEKVFTPTISATKIEKLLKNPYFYYLSDILKLKPLKSINEPLAKNYYGTIAHAVLESFLAEYKLNPQIITYKEHLIEEKLHSIIIKNLNYFINIMDVLVFWVPNLLYTLRLFVKELQSKCSAIQNIYLEEKASLELNNLTISGVADRIDSYDNQYAFTIIDYKTTSVQISSKKIELYNKQLIILASLLLRGAFNTININNLNSKDYTIKSLEYWYLPNTFDKNIKIKNILTMLKVDKVSEFIHQEFESILKTLSNYNKENVLYSCSNDLKDCPVEYLHLIRAQQWEHLFIHENLDLHEENEEETNYR